MAASITQNKMRFVREQISAAVGHSGIVVKVIASAIALWYLLSFISEGFMQSTIPHITVTPGYVIPPNNRVYSFFTYWFVELHFWHVIADIAVVILCERLLMPMWGAPDMVLFFIVVNLGVGFMTAVVYLGVYLVTLNEDFLFDVHIHGLAGYIAGFCVAVKQVMPDHCITTLPLGKLRNTHIPLTLLLITIILRLVHVLPGPYPIMFGWGIVVSWIYLRFYQKHSNGHRGDMAENFSFASIAFAMTAGKPYSHTRCFFPSQIQPLVAALANSVFSALVKIKVCKKPQRRYDVSSPTTITVTLPGTEPHDAERRKQLALKALNDRLTKSDSPPAWPSIDDDMSSPTTTPGSDTQGSASSSPLVLPHASQAALPAKLLVSDSKEKTTGGSTDGT